MPPRSERAQQLVKFVKSELEMSKTGEVRKLPTYRELGRQFGYKFGNAQRVLAKAGLTEEIKQAKGEITEASIEPSQELAWVTGVLVGGGFINLSHGSVNFWHTGGEELVSKFKNSGERLFGRNASRYERSNPSGRKQNQISFFGSDLANFFGDLTQQEWPRTISTKHQWIMNREVYVWQFLTGLFDTRGRIMLSASAKGIIFSTSRFNVANFIADCLVRVGIVNPKLSPAYQKGEGLEGVGIYNKKDMKTFALNVNSVMPILEAKLSSFRTLDLEKPRSEEWRKKPRKTRQRVSTTELINEWQKIIAYLGPKPRFLQINELQKEGKMLYKAELFARRFGRRENGRQSFVLARKNLKEIIKEREEAKETQIFP